MRRWGAIFCTLVVVACSVCGVLLFPDLVRSKDYPAWLAWVIAVVSGLCVIFLCYIALQNQNGDPQKDGQRFSDSEEVPRWVRYGHTRRPNAIVRGLYVVFDWVADFFPMFSALFRFIRKTAVNTWSLAVRTFLVGVNIALLVGVIYVSVGHSYEFLTVRAGMSGISAFVFVFVWEAMFVYCSIRLDNAYRNREESKAGAWIGFLMGWAFVELSNYLAMADNVYGKAVGLATPVILLVMKKVLQEQFRKQKKQSLLVLLLTAYRRKIEKKIFTYVHNMSDPDAVGVIGADRTAGQQTAVTVKTDIRMLEDRTTNSQTSDNRTINDQTTDNQTAANKTMENQITAKQTADSQTIGQQTPDNQNRQTPDRIETDSRVSDDQTTDNQESDIQALDDRTADNYTADNHVSGSQVTDNQTKGIQTSDNKTDSQASEEQTPDVQTLDNHASQDQTTDSQTTGNQASDNPTSDSTDVKESDSQEIRQVNGQNRQTKSNRRKKTDKAELSEVIRIAMQYRTENGDWPSIRGLANMAGCSKYKAEKALAELRQTGLKQSA